MVGRVRTLSIAAGLAVVIGGMSALVGAGQANAAEPIVVGDCKATVEGAPGQPISLSPAAVVAPIVSVVKAIPLLGVTLAAPAETAVRALPPIPVGAIPVGGGYIGGGQIATAVTDQLKTIPVLGVVINTVVSGVQGVLTTGCGITAKVANSVVAPVQDATGALPGNSNSNPGGGTTPGGGDTPGGTPGNGGTTPPGDPGNGTQPPGPGSALPPGWPVGDPGRVPPADYTQIPYVTAGNFVPSPAVRYGQDVPGYAPEIGSLGNGQPIDGVLQTAGRAQALPILSGDRVRLPVLLAVLVLSCVTAALVRTWVLRRAPGAHAAGGR